MSPITVTKTDVLICFIHKKANHAKVWKQLSLYQKFRQSNFRYKTNVFIFMLIMIWCHAWHKWVIINLQLSIVLPFAWNDNIFIFCAQIISSLCFGLISVRGKLNPANNCRLNFWKYPPLDLSQKTPTRTKIINFRYTKYIEKCLLNFFRPWPLFGSTRSQCSNRMGNILIWISKSLCWLK